MGQLAACQAAESSLTWEQGGATPLQKRWHGNGSTGRCYTSDSAAASSYGQYASDGVVAAFPCICIMWQCPCCSALADKPSVVCNKAGVCVHCSGSHCRVEL